MNILGKWKFPLLGQDGLGIGYLNEEFDYFHST